VAPPRSAFGRCKGSLPGRALLVVTESELLPAHAPSHPLRSQGNFRVDRLGFSESP
jgi:hypothetical protein